MAASGSRPPLPGLKRLQKERAKSLGEDIFPKLVEQQGRRPLIKDQLPTIFHPRAIPRVRSSSA